MAIEDHGDVVLGIDAGTTSLRAGLFTLRGELLGIYDANYTTRYPRPGWAEQHPSDWWDALVEAVRGCLATSGVDGERVIGLAVDAPCNILLADRDGTPLSESLLWMDLRGATQARQITETHDAVLRYCGGETPAEWPLPKALWLKQHESQRWEQAPLFVEQMSWLTWQLTGEWALPLNSAAAKWHYRTSADADTPAGWPVALLRTVGLEDLCAKVPERVVAMGAQAGRLTRRAADALGLRAGVAVAMSGIDAHAGMVGMHALTLGTLALITGTSTCQLIQSPHAVFDPGLWGPFEDAVLAGEWTLEAGQASTGGTVRWLLETLGGAVFQGPEGYAAADAAASAAAPGADGLTVLDYWQGSRTPIKDPHARGTIWGLTPAHSSGHLLRAVYEATAYGNRRILDMFSALRVPTERIVACGGGTRSTLWLRILADVAGIPLTVTKVPDAVALGSAMCAAVGAGAFVDLRQAGEMMVHSSFTIEPDAGLRAVYDDGYGRYQATYAALAPLFRQQRA